MNDRQLDMILGYLNEGTEIDEFEYEMANYLAEGANLDMRAEFKSSTKKIGELRKQFSIAIRTKNKEKATEAYNEMEKEVAKLKKNINAIDSSIGSALLGYFTAWTVTFFRNIFIGFIASLVKLGGPVIKVTELAEFIHTIKVAYSEIKKQGVNPDSLNMYKNAILRQIEILEVDMKKAKKRLNDLE